MNEQAVTSHFEHDQGCVILLTACSYVQSLWASVDQAEVILWNDPSSLCPWQQTGVYTKQLPPTGCVAGPGAVQNFISWNDSSEATFEL